MRKKLIEVALPLEAINAAAAREKSIRHGHPSTLHLWWARRPLAACRAVLFASLVDDPDSDPRFRALDGTVDVERAARKRNELFELIAELVKWENSNNPRVLNAARKEIARCVASQKVETGELARDAAVVAGATAWDFVVAGPTLAPEAVNAFLLQYAPPVLDPFCGGGSIPLEAQRLGLRAYASDLNPVAVLITKALIEIPPRFAGRPPVHPGAERRTDWPGATGLAEDVRYYGKWMRDEAAKRIGHLYPKVKVTKAMARERPDLEAYVGEELTVIAWLWARTVASPNPALRGAMVPLVHSFQLATKKGKEAWVRPVISRQENTYVFRVCCGKPPSEFNPSNGTVKRAGATCLLSGDPISFDYIRQEGKAGRLGQQLMAIVAEGERGRIYFSPTDDQTWIALSAKPTNYPDTDLPEKALSFRVMLYGMNKHFKLFTSRQLVALTTLSDLLQVARKRVQENASASGVMDDSQGLEEGGGGVRAYADAVATYLAFGLDKNTLTNSTQATWQNNPDRLTQTFARQALPMTWDYAEANPLSRAGGGFVLTLDAIAEVFAKLPAYCPDGVVEQRDATKLPEFGTKPVISTDPPYYDNIGYADLSDYFYVWLRRSLGEVYPRLLRTMLVPKAEELVATPYRFGGDREKAEAFFEHGLGQAFACMREQQCADYPLNIYYAFKQTEDEKEEGSLGEESRGNGKAARSSTGWETMLEGLLGCGFTITGTWPMRTELITSLKKTISALATSIVIVCRPRSSETLIATRKDFLTALRNELPEALRGLQASNIAPVDLAQAAIGPGMAVFSRYTRVLEAGDKPMSVRTALGLINQTLDEVLAEQEGDFDPATRWTVAWFEQNGLDDGPFGVAETLSKAKNTAVNALVESGLVIARGGKVRLRKRSELPEGWEPADARCPIWEVTQRLVHTLENDGEAAAAALLPELGGRAETARELAYRLYTICERKKWADEALAYNGLVIAWPELLKLALAHRTATLKQAEFFPEEGS